MRILIFGGAGQLGADLVHAFEAGHDVVAPSHEEVNLTAAEGVATSVERLAPDWVVTAAAFHDVDRCEDEASTAFSVNAVGAWNAARAARAVGARVAYISTDYVFAGSRGAANSETDSPEPANVYGVSKLAGEQLTRAADPRALIARTSALFGTHPCRGKKARNFIDLMIDLGESRGAVRVVDDEVVSPTNTAHLAAALVRAVEIDLAGIVHLAGAGAVSWKGLAEAVFEDAGMKVDVAPAAPGEFLKKAPRPPYSALVCTREDAAEVRLPAWRDGLRAYLDARGRRP